MVLFFSFPRTFLVLLVCVLVLHATCGPSAITLHSLTKFLQLLIFYFNFFNSFLTFFFIQWLRLKVSFLNFQSQPYVTIARHGPLLEADTEELTNQCEFWGHCAIGFILDYRRFSVSHLQHLISVAWRIRGAVNIVGRDSSFYILHFEFLEDLNHMCSEGPWSVDGALLILEKWRPNLVVSNL